MKAKGKLKGTKMYNIKELTEGDKNQGKDIKRD